MASWNKQEPPATPWGKQEPQPIAWPAYDPFAAATLWDTGNTVWDDPTNPTLWDYTPVYFEVWSKHG